MSRDNTNMTLDVALGLKLPKLVLPVPDEVRAKVAEQRSALLEANPDAEVPEHLPVRIVLELREPKLKERSTLLRDLENAPNEEAMFEELTKLAMRYAQPGTPRDVVRALWEEATSTAIGQFLVAIQTGALPDPKRQQQLLLAMLDKLEEQLLRRT